MGKEGKKEKKRKNADLKKKKKPDAAGLPLI